MRWFRHYLIGVALAALAALLLGLSACGSTTKTSTSGGPEASATIAGVTVTSDSTLHDMLPDNIKSTGIIRDAIDCPYPPWEMYLTLGTDQFTGFEIDMIRAVGAKLGVQVYLQNSIFDSIIPALQADKVDITTSAMYDNLDREKVLDFVDWAIDGSTFVVQKGNPAGINGLADLAGKTVATQSGTSYVPFLTSLQKQFQTEGKPAMTLLQFGKDAEALLAVRTGKAVADMTDGPSAAYIVQTAGAGDLYQLIIDPSNPNGYLRSYIGVGILKKNTQLRDAIKAAFEALMQDGTYSKILQKYQVPMVAVKAIVVNQAKY